MKIKGANQYFFLTFKKSQISFMSSNNAYIFRKFYLGQSYNYSLILGMIFEEFFSHSKDRDQKSS